MLSPERWHHCRLSNVKDLTNPCKADVSHQKLYGFSTWNRLLPTDYIGYCLFSKSFTYCCVGEAGSSVVSVLHVLLALFLWHA